MALLVVTGFAFSSPRVGNLSSGSFVRVACAAGGTELYGCNRKGGGEVIPFIHSEPIQFIPSGFALVAEVVRGDLRQGGYFYVDARYEQKTRSLDDGGHA